MRKVLQVVRNRLQNLLSNYSWAQVFLAWLVFGFFVYHYKAEWSDDKMWDYAWYMWETVAFATGTMMAFKYEGRLMKRYWPILVYLILRLCIQIMTFLIEMDINAKPIVFALFMASLAACLYLTVYEDGHKMLTIIKKTFKFLKEL